MGVLDRRVQVLMDVRLAWGIGGGVLVLVVGIVNVAVFVADGLVSVAVAVAVAGQEDETGQHEEHREQLA